MQMTGKTKGLVAIGAVVVAGSLGAGIMWASSNNAPAVNLPPETPSVATAPTSTQRSAKSEPVAATGATDLKLPSAAALAPTGTPIAARSVTPATALATMPSSGTNNGSTGSGSSSSSGSSGSSGSSSSSGSAGSASSKGNSSPTTGSATHAKHGAAHQTKSAAQGGQAAVSKAASASSFIGAISASNVNIRSGPGLRYYVVGQLSNGNLVNVVKTTKGWDAISAPAGARCYVAKQFVKLNASGTRGTITSRFVNLRAASALTPTSDYAVVGVARRGQRVSVVGHTGMFTIIRAPMHTHFYVYASFVKPAPAGSTYISPQLQMPPGFKGVAVAGLAPASVAAGSAPAANSSAGNAGGNAPSVVVPAPGSGSSSATTTPSSNAALTPAPVGPAAIAPVSTYNPKVYTQFAKLDKALVAQFKKPLLERKLKKIAAGFKALLKEKHLPGSIRSATQQRIQEIKRMCAIQALASTPAAEAPVTATIAPYQQQWEQSKKILEKSIATAPFVAKGMLETSHTVHEYALLNPNNGRVVAYVQPSKNMDLSKLIGSYVGIKGLVVSKTGAFIRVIRPNSATLLPAPNP